MIDLYSDTHTLPDAGMRKAVAEAEVGDAQLGEDPTTNRVEEAVAELLGTEAALFVPTGSMCNKVAVGAFTRPGEAVAVDHLAHVYRFEGGAPAALWGVVFEPIVTERGQYTPGQLEEVLNPGNVYQPRTSLVFVEQTHNFGGGTVWPLDVYESVCATARGAGASVCVDGARLLNAVIATGVPPDRWAAAADATWIDFAKGLGAPGGAAIAGSAAFIEEANRFMYLLGGAIRQPGFLAAAALYGLEHNVERLADDHANARRLAEGLADRGLAVESPESNMVYFHPPEGADAAEFIDRMRTAGVRSALIAGRIRLVTHLGVSAQDVEDAIEVIGGLV